MELKDYRAQIDRIDAEILRLFAERMELAAQIAAYKKAQGLAVLDSAREQEKLREVAEKLPEPLRCYGAQWYERLFALSRSYQEALLGEDGEVK